MKAFLLVILKLFYVLILCWMKISASSESQTLSFEWWPWPQQWTQTTLTLLSFGEEKLTWPPLTRVLGRSSMVIHFSSWSMALFIPVLVRFFIAETRHLREQLEGVSSKASEALVHPSVREYGRAEQTGIQGRPGARNSTKSETCSGLLTPQGSPPRRHHFSVMPPWYCRLHQGSHLSTDYVRVLRINHSPRSISWETSYFL